MRPRKYQRNPDQLPLFVPESDWRALEPWEWPDLSYADAVGVDTETDDPKLEDYGPGFIRGDASCCGVSLATERHKLYLPIGHTEGNVDRGAALRYIHDQITRPRQAKVGANLMYDLEVLASLGLRVQGPVHDIQVAEAVLDEDRPGGYSLDALARSYLGKGKTEDLLSEAEVAYGLDHKKGMAKLPARFVGPYAEDDAEDTLLIWLQQEDELHADEVWDIYQLEMQLLPVLLKMRTLGVRVDVDRAQRLEVELQKEEDELFAHLQRLAGRPFSHSSTRSMVPILQERGIHVPLTAPSKNFPNGQWSVTNDLLVRNQKDEFCRGLVAVRRTAKMRSDFVRSFILDMGVRGRLHTTWHPLREQDDEGGSARGTRTGRIASSKPNLTQIPSRDPRWGPLIRSLFIPENGARWVKSDYSQQEPRIWLHYACVVKNKWGERLPGALEARQRYIDDPDTDYHTMTRELIIKKADKDIGRRNSKTVNLGVAYGEGLAKIMAQLGVSKTEGREILAAYFKGVPYVKPLSNICMERVQERGFVTTILGRKRRFKRWEPADWKRRYGTTPVRNYDDAVRIWGEVARADAHKALNAVVQGSAADQIKKCLILLDDEGITPHVQIYDELNGSFGDDPEIRRFQEIMEHAIPEFTVPFKADPSIGPSWGEVVDYRWDGDCYVVEVK